MQFIKSELSNPKLGWLEAETEAVNQALRAVESDWQRHGRALKQIDPARWTLELERYVGNEDVLSDFRILREEELLTYESTRLRYQASTARLAKDRAELSKALKLAIALPKELADCWIRQVVENNCLMAANSLHSPVPGEGEEQQIRPDDDGWLHHDLLALLSKTHGLLVKSFEKLERAHSKHAWTKADVDGVTLFVGSSLGTLYPTDLITTVPNRRDSRRPSPPREWREIDYIPCPRGTADSVQGFKFPGQAPEPIALACRALPSELDGLEKLLIAAEKELRYYKENYKGSINERQYQARLIELLDSEHPAWPGETTIASQRRSRCEYEGARVRVKAAIIAAELQRVRAVEALRAAMPGVKSLIGQLSTGISAKIVESERPTRIAIVNCLAADLLIRRTGTCLEAAMKELEEDLSGGQGRKTLNAEFRQLVEKLQESKKAEEDE